MPIPNLEDILYHTVSFRPRASSRSYRGRLVDLGPNDYGIRSVGGHITARFSPHHVKAWLGPDGTVNVEAC